MLRINTVSLINFKGIENSKIAGFREGMNIVTGSNGCGKTTAIEAMAYALTADEHELGISGYSDFVGAKNDGCAVMLSGQQTDSSAPIVLQRELIRNMNFYLLNKDEVSKDSYQGTIGHLGIRSSAKFVPVFTEKMNKPPKTASDLGEYFGHLSGGTETGWKIETCRQLIKEAEEALAKAHNDCILLEQERAKSSAYYLVKLYLYDEQIREKEREILLAKDNEERMKIINRNTNYKPNSSKISKKQRKEPSLSERLEASHEELRDSRFFHLREAQINKIDLPYSSTKHNVLWPREIRGREDPLAPNSPIQKTPKLNQNRVRMADGVRLDYSTLLDKFDQKPNKEMIETRCASLRDELNAIRLEQNQQYKDLFLIQREAMCKKLLFEKQRKIETLQDDIFELTIQRRDLFYNLFEPVASLIDKQYQCLRDKSQVERHVSLSIRQKNEEKPWRAVEFELITKGGAEDFEDVTGGEEKLAELALAFALIEATSSPVAIFDDVDKGIYDQYYPQIASFLLKKSTTCQLIVSASNPEFLRKVKGLGVPSIEL